MVPSLGQSPPSGSLRPCSLGSETPANSHSSDSCTSHLHWLLSPSLTPQSRSCAPVDLEEHGSIRMPSKRRALLGTQQRPPECRRGQGPGPHGASLLQDPSQTPQHQALQCGPPCPAPTASKSQHRAIGPLAIPQVHQPLPNPAAVSSLMSRLESCPLICPLLSFLSLLPGLPTTTLDRAPLQLYTLQELTTHCSADKVRSLREASEDTAQLSCPT